MNDLNSLHLHLPAGASWRKGVLVSTLTLYAIGCALSQSLMSLAGTLAALVWAACLVSSFRNGDFRRLRVLEKISIFAVLLFVVSAIIHLALIKKPSEWIPAAKDLPLYVIPTLAVFPAMRRHVHESTLTCVVYVCMASYAISSLYGIAQVVLLGQPSAIGFLRNPLYYSYNLLFALAFFLGVFWKQTHTRMAAAAFACSLLILAAIVASSSRMPLLVATALTLTVLLASALRTRNYRPIFGTLTVLALLIALSFRSNPVFRSKMTKMIALNVRTDRSAQGRLAVWAYNKKLFLENPLWGVGYQQNYLDASQDRAFRRLWKPGHAIYAHSIYLQSLADSGALGSVLIFGSYVALAAAHPSAWIVWGSALVAGSTENIFNNSKAAHSLWFFFLMSILYPWRARRNNNAVPACS